MDPITHGLTGAATGYALFGHKLGKHSAVLGALAGMAPDVDHFVSSKTNVLLYVEVHRAFTHSIAFSLFGAFVSILPWLFTKFRNEWKTLWLCAWPAYLTHCFLDASTTYGTQLLWPFTNFRFGWDLIAVVDLFFTATLAIGLGFSLRNKHRKYAAISLLLCCGYLAFGGIQKTRAARVQAEIAESRAHNVERGEVMPTLTNLILWRSVYVYNGKIYSDRIRVGLFGLSTFREGAALPLVTKDTLNSEEKAANDGTQAFERFAWFSDQWVARSPIDPTVLADMRYSISTSAFDPIWGIRFHKDGDKVRLEWINRQLKRKLNLGELWSEIIGTHPDFHTVTTVVR